KLKEESFDKLQQEWFGRLSADDKRALNTLDNFSHHKNDTDIHKSFDFAIGHSFERLSVLPEKRFWETILKHGVGALSVEEVKKYRHEKLLYAQTERGRAVSTKEVLMEEQKMFGIAREGKGSCLALNASEGYKPKNNILNDRQQKAVDYLLESNDRVMVLSGGAGVGKSTLLSELEKGINSNGREVLALAPSSGAREVLEKEGFAAKTLQKFLLDKELQEKQKGQVVVLDEAGLVGTKQMKQLFEMADKNDFRLVLSGDEFQHHSVEHGDAFRLLIQQNILPSFRVQEVVRQKGDYKKAMECLSTNRLDAGFEILDSLGWVQECKPKKIFSAIADEYVKQTESPDAQVLVVAPTHKEGHEITAHIRAKLKVLERLDATTAKNYESVFALNLTGEEKKESRSYEPGQQVIFHKAEKGFNKGKAYQVEECSQQGIFLMSAAGKRQQLPLQLENSFGVFRPQKTEVCTGDKIRINANGKTNEGHRLINGAEYSVKGFDKAGQPVLNNGWIVPADFKQWGLGYVGTSHGQQGKTVDSVLVLQDAAGMVSKEGFYVASSRARKQAKIFTTDKEELMQAVKKSSSRLSATELAFRAEKQQQRIVARTKFMQFVHRVKASLRGLGNLGAAPPRSQGKSPQLDHLQHVLNRPVYLPQRVFSMKDRRIQGYEPAHSKDY
ncbi:MAG: AAA family ATPase, partial [Bacteroidota bacterium]